MHFLFQTERSFQKQPTVFLNKKSSLLSTKGKKNLRYVKNVGLGFKTPREVLPTTEKFNCVQDEMCQCAIKHSSALHVASSFLIVPI